VRHSWEVALFCVVLAVLPVVIVAVHKYSEPVPGSFQLDNDYFAYLYQKFDEPFYVFRGGDFNLLEIGCDSGPMITAVVSEEWCCSLFLGDVCYCSIGLCFCRISARYVGTLLSVWHLACRTLNGIKFMK
jgi:hypothetical protein